MQDHASDLFAAAVGQKMAVGGGTTALIFGLAASDLAAIGGLLVAVVGVLVQIYYKRRADRREAALTAAQMDALQRHG